MPVAVDYLYRQNTQPLGLAVAVDAFMCAWLRYASEPHFLCHTADAASFAHFAEMAGAYSKNASKPCVQINPTGSPKFLKDISCLFIPDPDLNPAVWRRTQIMGTGYATCGIVHSLSGDEVARAVGSLCLSPTHGADALICPSQAIQKAVKRLWEINESYLARRFGTKFTCPVQTPVIPLGIDTDKMAARATPALRAAEREALGIGEDDIVILFVGRLNFATKAHPLPLLLAASKAAQQTRRKIHLIFNGTFKPQREMEQHFNALIQDFAQAPLTAHVIEHSDPRFPHGLWAAADIFTSLIDNVQESFGLTPIEAMACGLPSVVADWDGYRDGVRHGLDGFLIPTYLPPSDNGNDIATLYFNEQNYGRYLVASAQSTCIDIEAAAKAFVTLADNKSKRLEMGLQAQARARNMYDWRVIIPAYEQLWRKLSEDRLRYASMPQTPIGWPAFAPDYPNPWYVFESFATRSLTAEDRIACIMSPDDIALLVKHEMNFFVPELLLPQALLLDLMETLRTPAGFAIQELLAVTPESERPRLWRSLGWLLKHGVCVKLSA